MLTLGALAVSLALHFEPNQGRLSPETKYVAVSAGYSVALSDTGVTLLFPSGKSLTMKLPRTRLQAEDLQAGVSNYYAGSDRSSWRTGIPHFGRMRYRSVFHGVDLAIYGNGRQVEYDWVVSPGADPARIRFSFQGCSNAHLDPNGDLVLTVPGGELRHRRPFIYQVVNGVKLPVGGGFVRGAGRQFGFRVDKYDRSKALVIDPTLVFASGFGGLGYTALYSPYPLTADTSTGVVLDGLGNIYVSGFSSGWNFPLVNASGPVPPACQNCQRSWQFVAKLSPDGKNLLYATFVAQPDLVLEPPPSGEGFNEWDVPGGRSIAADVSGNVYVVGSTTGASFPSVNGQPVTTAGGSDVFVMKLNPAGQLVGATLLGGQGDDFGNSIVLGADGGLYLTGTTESSDFPTTTGAYQTHPVSFGANVFLAKLNPAAIGGGALSASPVIYSTYLGPGLIAFAGWGSAPLIATDSSNNAYVAAQSGLWATTPGAFQSAPPAKTGGEDIVLAKVNPSGTKLLYATYFDGSGGDFVRGLAVDSSGSAYLSGYTTSTDLPTTSGSLQPKPPPAPSQGGVTGFVARFSADATRLIYATYLGGTGGHDYNYGLAVDSAGNAYVGGASESADFPIRNGTQVSLENSPCLFYYGPSSTQPSGVAYCASAGTLTVLNPQGSAIVWSTFLGSGAVMDVALDSAGNVYATGADIVLKGTTLGSSATNSVGVVKFAPQGTPVQFSWNGLTNAASFNPGLPGPGGLASVFVHGVAVSGTVAATGFPLPITLAGVSILVDGTPAPILVVADLGSVNGVNTQQINFQVPFEAPVITSPGHAHVVELRYGGLSTYAAPQNVGPGIFVLPDGTPAIQHAADYSLVTASNPVVKGETIVVYATGLGSVVNGPATGTPATGAAPVSPACGAVTINAPTPPGGTARSSFGNVVYAGLTPGYVGLYQLNVATLPSLPSGTMDLQIDYNQCWPIAAIPYPPTNYFQSNTVKVPVQ